MSEYEDRCTHMPNKKIFKNSEEAYDDFIKNALTNKSQVVDRIKTYIDKINSNEMLQNMTVFDRSIIVSSLYRVLREITYKLFPDLSKQEGRWSYTIYIFEGKIQIRYQVIGFSLAFMQWMIEQYDTFYECETVLYSVSEYAEQHRVSETTVREWIRRGKIDSAVKKGLEWFIPALTKPLDKLRSSIRFERESYDDDFSDFPIINNDAEMIVIEKAKRENGIYKLFQFDFDGNMDEKRILSKPEMLKIRRRLLESYDFKPIINNLIFAENY